MSATSFERLDLLPT